MDIAIIILSILFFKGIVSGQVLAIFSLIYASCSFITDVKKIYKRLQEEKEDK